MLTGDGKTLFPSTAVLKFGAVKIGFIGMTLKETGTLVTPSGVAGLHFADEAQTANALVPKLQAQGANTIVLLLHQGGYLTPFDDRTCKVLNGPILPILDKLDPAISVVVSGHTHHAYICEIAERSGGGTRLLTSSSKYGTLLTNIRLRFSRRTHTLLSRSANFHVVQGEGFTIPSGTVATTKGFPVDRADPQVAAIVHRYADAARPFGERVVAHLAAPVSSKADVNGEAPLGDLIADAQLAWARSHGGADLALMNAGGVRTDLTPGPDGRITYGQLFSLQPFGNGIVVHNLTGEQLTRLLEQQFDSGTNTAQKPNMLSPSTGFDFSYDLGRPAGQRIVAATLNGKPLDPSATYRVATNSFMSSGGDNFAVLLEATEKRETGLDLDALETYLATAPAMPAGDRVKKVGATPATAFDA